MTSARAEADNICVGSGGLAPYDKVMEARASNTKLIVTTLGLSAVAFAFLVWLIYFNTTAWIAPEQVAFLPAVNASFNASSAILVTFGIVAVKRGKIDNHKKFMIGALVMSALFLVSYLIYHAAHGDTKFMGQGVIRPIYFFILISHILLSAVALPMVLLTATMGLMGRLPGHRRIAKYTFPIWLYVSVTGVLIFVLLKSFG